MFPHGQDILVVDNDPARRGLIERILADEGFAVTAVAEGLAALREAGRRRFSVIIAAAGLPGSLDGAATVRQARARQPWLKALFTEHATHCPRWDDPDSDEFIAAPFQRRELLGCVFELTQRDMLPGAVALARRYRAELTAS